MAILENKVLEREEKLDQKLEKIEQSKEALREREKEIDEIIKKQNEQLAEIAKLTPEEAKQELLDNIEKSSQTEIKSFINKRKMIKKEESEKEAAQIVARSLPKMAGEATGEFTSVLVDIPNEDFKGKLIGRE
jgi:ribonuclease Y